MAIDTTRFDTFHDIYETISIYKACLVCESQESVQNWIEKLKQHDFSCGSVEDMFNNPNIRLVVIQMNEVKYLLDDNALDTINAVFCETHTAFRTVLAPLHVLLKNPQYYFTL